MNWWTPIIIGICSLMGAFGGITLKQIWDARNTTKNILFSVYMKLLELYGLYWWETVAEFHKNNPNPDRRSKIGRLSWLISDELWQIDESDFSEDILEVLFSSDIKKYPTAISRYDAIGKIIDSLGQHLNPKHSTIMKKISDTNLRELTVRYKNGFPKEEIKENTPGHFMFWN